MKKFLLGGALAFVSTAANAQMQVTHFPPTSGPMGAPMKDPPFSGAVMAGDTLYVSGTTDTDPTTGKPPADARVGARLVMDNIQRGVERAGLKMDDLVWVQVFASDLGDYAAFNEVYRGYFKAKKPARAFIGAGTLLNGAHFEVTGIAVRRK
jgi:2-iminobutanoate/2-iminopropanoate deaminase